jgi:4-oxalocrotonate tautomerase
MPLVHVDLMEGRSPERIAAMIRSVSEAIADSLEAPIESVRVVVNQMAPHEYGVGASRGPRSSRNAAVPSREQGRDAMRQVRHFIDGRFVDAADGARSRRSPRSTTPRSRPSPRAAPRTSIGRCVPPGGRSTPGRRCRRRSGSGCSAGSPTASRRASTSSPSGRPGTWASPSRRRRARTSRARPTTSGSSPTGPSRPRPRRTPSRGTACSPTSCTNRSAWSGPSRRGTSP